MHTTRPSATSTARKHSVLARLLVRGAAPLRRPSPEHPQSARLQALDHRPTALDEGVREVRIAVLRCVGIRGFGPGLPR